MSENAIVKTKETRIAPWGDRAEIREIAQRVQLMAPGAKKLSENEALALAQGAVAHGLDPFNGEIWFIPGSGLMTGIKGLRKAAKNQIAGNYWPEFSEITDPDERKRLFIPKDALAYKCLIRDSETIRAYSEAWKNLAENKVPVKTIPTIIGEKPYTEGVGYYEVGEKTKMKPVQVAMKRAEADALKRRFDLPFAIPTEPNDMPIVEGDWYEADENLSEQAAEGEAALFGTEPQAEPRQENQWEQEIIDRLVDLQLVQAKPHAVNILNRSPFMSVPYHQLEVVEAVAYIIGWGRLDDKLSSDEKQAAMNKSWNEGDNDDLLDKAIEMLGGKND